MGAMGLLVMEEYRGCGGLVGGVGWDGFEVVNAEDWHECSD